MANTITVPLESPDDDKLAEFGLTTTIIHDALRPGGSRAGNRSALALPSSPGTDVYHDGMEGLHRLLKPLGWNMAHVDGQPRLLHPDSAVSMTISSAINVGAVDMRLPRTRKKGPATRKSLAPQDLLEGLFADIDAELQARIDDTAKEAPFYFLLWERISVGGNGLALELSRPGAMTPGGSVNDWTDRIQIPFLNLDGDLETFEQPAEADDIEVHIEPR